MHALERLQQKAIDLENQIKEESISKYLAKQLIAGAKEYVDYSYQKEQDCQWFVHYIAELEKRV